MAGAARAGLAPCLQCYRIARAPALASDPRRFACMTTRARFSRVENVYCSIRWHTVHVRAVRVCYILRKTNKHTAPRPPVTLNSRSSSAVEPQTACTHQSKPSTSICCMSRIRFGQSGAAAAALTLARPRATSIDTAAQLSDARSHASAPAAASADPPQPRPHA